NDSYTVHAFAIGSQGQVVTITGDEQFINQDDTFLIQRDATNTGILNFLVNGVLEYTAPLSNITQINVFGLGGNDLLTVDSTGGLIATDNGIRYDGGGGTDVLRLLQSDATVY